MTRAPRPCCSPSSTEISPPEAPHLAACTAWRAASSTDTAPLAAQGAGVGRSGRSRLDARLAHTLVPVLTVVAALIALWYVACVPMNAAQSVLNAARADVAVSPESAADRRGMSGLALASEPGRRGDGAFTQDRPDCPRRTRSRPSSGHGRRSARTSPRTGASSITAGSRFRRRCWASASARCWGSRWPSGSCIPASWT